MTATLAPNTWAPPTAPPHAALRFGQPWAASGLQWVLRRNCSIAPQQLAAVYAALCVFSLFIASGFAWVGAPAVLAFAGLESVLVGAALLVYARHALDGDTLTLDGPLLAVEQNNGARRRRTEFRAEWVSIEPCHGDRSLIELSGQGQRVRVARFVRPELRAALAQELRAALRCARQSA